MFKAKKNLLIAALLVVSLLVTLVGCSQPAETPEPAEEKEIKDMGYANPESLISVKELKEIMDDENVVIVGVNVSKHIPGAVSFKEEDFNAKINGVPDMRPESEKWAEALSKHGIENDDTIVIYDAKNMLLSARVWWVFKYYNHENVRILNGGIKAWENAGYETGSPAEREATNYEIKAENTELLATIDTIKATFDNDNQIPLDTRSEKEWKDGHVPGAVWVEWTNAINEDGTFKSGEELKALYEGKGITADKELIAPYCLGGWRAANSMFVLQELLGYENVKNYDGSWAEYGESGETIEK